MWEFVQEKQGWSNKHQQATLGRIHIYLNLGEWEAIGCPHRSPESTLELEPWINDLDHWQMTSRALTWPLRPESVEHFKTSNIWVSCCTQMAAFWWGLGGEWWGTSRFRVPISFLDNLCAWTMAKCSILSPWNMRFVNQIPDVIIIFYMLI